MPDPRPEGQDSSAARGVWRPRIVVPAVVLGVFLAFALPLILTGWKGGRAYFDQFHYHEPTIRAFAAQWPAFDLANYSSATAPGYHLALAAVERYAGSALAPESSRRLLQLAGMMVTAALASILGWAVGKRAEGAGLGAFTGIAAVLPVFASLYVFMPGVWLAPDNAGWLGVLIVLLIALRPQYRWIDALGAGLVLAALVFTRQSHLWCAGLIWVWAWTAAGPLDRWSPNQLLARPYERAIALAWGVAVTLPAFAIVWLLYRLWGGLTPKGFQDQHAGGNGAAPALALSLLAIYSGFFGAWCVPAMLRLWRERRWVLAAGGVGGLALSLIAPTTYFYESRGSGFWNLVKVFDGVRGFAWFVRPIKTIPSGPGVRGTPDTVLKVNGAMAEGTNLLVVLLSCAGGVCLVAWLSMLRARERLIIAAALAGFVLAQSFNANAWQRYFEPLLLMMLALIAAGASVPQTGDEVWGRRLRALRFVGPLALAAALAALTVVKVLEDPHLHG